MGNHVSLDPVLLRTIIDLIPCIVFVRDLSGKLVLVNRKYANFFGFEPIEIEGCIQKELYEKLGWLQPLIDVWLNEDNAVVQGGSPISVQEKVNHRNGQICLYETSKYPVKLADGSNAVLVISHQVVERC